MLSRFKKKLVELKTDLNHSIDRLDVDRARLLNRSHRAALSPALSLNGLDYLIKRENCNDLTRHLINENQLASRQFDEGVKESFKSASSLFHAIRTLQKELQLACKSVESLHFIIGNVEELCVGVHRGLAELEWAYEARSDEARQLQWQQALEREEAQRMLERSSLLDQQNGLEERENKKPELAIRNDDEDDQN